MSNLEELIERLCPDGVEYKEINDCTIKVQNIKWKSYVGEDKQYIDLSSVDRERNIITETQNINADTAPSRAQQIVMKDDIILGTTRPMLKRYCIIPEKYDGEICSTGFCVLRAKTDIINPRWLYHNITTKKFFAYVEKNQQGASYPAISDTIVKAFKLPVPPLEVQREIVRILDNFTFLTAELAAELAARQKQYEYYKVNLLLENNQSPNVTLNDIAINRDSQRKPVTSSKRESGNIPYYGASGIVDYVKDYIFDGDYLLVSEDGANLLARNTPIAFSIQGKTWVNNHAHILEFDNYYTRRYVEFYLNSIDLTPYISGGAQPKLNQKNLNSIKIPLPVLQEQQRIVGVLDRFDSLCNDISSGLPAEIEARQKQYEYYRDKLLSFKELKKEA